MVVDFLGRKKMMQYYMYPEFWIGVLYYEPSPIIMVELTIHRKVGQTNRDQEEYNGHVNHKYASLMKSHSKRKECLRL